MPNVANNPFMRIVVVLNVVMLNVKQPLYAECCYAEHCHADCRLQKGHYGKLDSPKILNKANDLAYFESDNGKRKKQFYITETRSTPPGQE